MKQLTIISENRPGITAEVTEALAKQNINIESMDGETFDDTGIIILSVDNYDLALFTLNKIPGINVISEDVILIRIANQPGALAQIANRFKQANMNIRSIRFVQRDQDYGIVAISTERSEEAIDLVKDVLVS
ncbi:MAG: ACT domain-containing protein [Gammaproteobacteria bacterium]|nr:ACT domain-containing protein [Gammaproteobacteria bacterium]